MNNDMVLVSRELLERVCLGDASRQATAPQLVSAWAAMDEIRAILAAPATPAAQAVKLPERMLLDDPRNKVMGWPRNSYNAALDAVAKLNAVQPLRDFNPEHTLFSEIRGSTPVSEEDEELSYLITESQLQRIRALEFDSQPAVPTADMADAYVGAREDLAIWKKRALEAEAKLRTYDQRIVDLGVLGMQAAVKKPAALSEDEERKAFEKAVVDKAIRFHPDLKQYGDEPNAEYRCANIEWAWSLWLARAALGRGSQVSGKYAEVLNPFLAMMECELHANSGKGDRPGWLTMTPETCLLEIIYHFGKLQRASKHNEHDGVREYAADVANMCMMLVDIHGALGDWP